MQPELTGFSLIIFMLFSQIAMLLYSYEKQKETPATSIFCYLATYSIHDYIRITTEEKGRIGIWFWTFLFSCISLFFFTVKLIFMESYWCSAVPASTLDTCFPIL